MTNYRWGGYLLVAMGLLNMRYQTGEPGVVTNSLIILTPGVLILVLSFIPKTAALLNTKIAQRISIVVGIAAIIFAAVN
ncbi:MAG: hypothetical protein QNL78_01920 [Actinomycetes bacterium]|tara:strand:- start:737 stop:973 length:237 start_codon:yes stop_codon:yes gene_type:complete